MSTSIEERLSAALEARTALVQPEHLTPSSPPGPARPGGDEVADDAAHPAGRDAQSWSPLRRWTAYAAVAAAALTALVLPVRLADGPDQAPQPAEEPVAPPEGWVGGVGRTGPGADLPGARVSADVDGDGAPDTVWLRTAPPDAPLGPVRVEVLLSSAPAEVRWTVLRERGGFAQLEGSFDERGLRVQLDDEPGSELLVLFQPPGDGNSRLAALDLVDGRLVEADVDHGPDDAPFGVGLDAERRRLHFGVLDGTLVTGRTREPAYTEARYRRSEAWTWSVRSAEPGQRPVLAPTPRADVCRDEYGYGFGDCRPGTDRPVDDDAPVGEGGNPSDVVPDFLPEARWHSEPGQGLAFTTDSGSGTAQVSGTAEDWRLEVELDGATYAAGLGSGERPPALVAGTVASETAPGFAVVRGAGEVTEWSVWTVRGGELVEVEVLADEVPLGSGLRGSGDGAESYGTHLSTSGLLSTRVTDPTAGGSEVAQVWTWSLDEGPALVATPAGCFRFPADGSTPTFAARC